MDDLISRQAAIDAIGEKSDEIYKTKQAGATFPHYDLFQGMAYAADIVENMPSAQSEIIRCKDCKHQRKEYREDKRRKDGGYNIYWCELVDGYAPLGFDDEYCAWAERKSE